MTSSDRSPEQASRVPVLVVAAVLVALEALVLLGVGVTVVLGSDSARLLLDITTTAFFVLYGGGLLVCSWGLLRVHRWARAPVVLAQLIQLLVAWSFFSGATRGYAVAMAAAAAVVLGCTLSRRATRALVEDEPAY